MNIVSNLKRIFEKFLLRFFWNFYYSLIFPGYPPTPSQGSHWSPRSPVFRTLRKERLDDSHLAAILETLLLETYSRICWLGLISARKSVLNMGRLRRKRMHKNDKHLKKKYRTKRRTKDLDQIHVDMQPQNATKLKSQEVDMDLPGAGQYYCIQCA